MFAYSAESTFAGRVDRRGRQVVEAHARRRSCRRWSRRRATPAKKRLSWQREVALEQRVVAGHGRVGRVHQRVPVDLVQPDRRVAPEGAARGAVDRVADLRRRSRRAAAARRGRGRRRRDRRRPRRRRRGAGRRRGRSSSSPSRARGPGRRRAWSVTNGGELDEPVGERCARGASLRAGPRGRASRRRCRSSSMHRVRPSARTPPPPRLEVAVRARPSAGRASCCMRSANAQ